MPMESPRTRRQVLAAAVSGTSLLLSGCSQLTDSSETPIPDDGKPTATETPTTATETATPTPATLPNDGESWPMFGYDAANTRYSPHTSGPSSQPRVIWRTEPPEMNVHGLTVVYQGTSYIAGSQSIDSAGNSNGTLVSLDSDGDILWKRTVSDDGFGAQLAVTEDSLYASSVEGILHATDRADGSIRWTVDMGGSSHLAVIENRLYASTPPDGITAMTTDGDELWEYMVTNDESTFRVHAVTGNGVYVSGTKLHALETDGTHRWSYDAEKDQIRDPVATGDSIYASVHDQTSIMQDRAESRDIVALTPAGERLWQSNQPGLEMVSVSDERLLVPRRDGIVALDPRTGDEQWQYDCSHPTPAVIGNEAIYTNTYDTVHAIDRVTGEQLWQHPFETDIDRESITSAPIVVDDTVSVAGEWGTINTLQ